MKIMQATDAKNRFGELLEDAISEPVLIQKNGRDVAVVMSKDGLICITASNRKRN